MTRRATRVEVAAVNAVARLADAALNAATPIILGAAELIPEPIDNAIGEVVTATYFWAARIEARRAERRAFGLNPDEAAAWRRIMSSLRGDS